MKKIKLQFMVVPEQLASMAYVPDSVRIKVIDPEAIFLMGLLGESGKKLVAAGIEFYFTKKLANKLINKGIAIKVKEIKEKEYVDFQEIHRNLINAGYEIGKKKIATRK